MDQATLVNLDVDAGARAVVALDDAKIRVVVALWMVSDDHDDWRLVLSSPFLDQSRLLDAYQEVAKALHGRFLHMPPPILILPTKDPFIRDLRKLFGKTKDVNGMRLGGQMIGNRFVSDAYVYRIH
ncbi:MAG: hypothetical protein M3Y50_16965 [Acidobacteriota bacterium]|nr:hypothetical protein [Acidobacteriota bacterium]